MRTILAISALLLTLPVEAQVFHVKRSSSGIISLGARSSIGIVNDGKWQRPAFGTGGQFRIRFSDRVNTDWFMDYLTADLDNYAWRADCHIGWSVLYYLSKNPDPVVQPYLLAGHCFEYLKFTENNNSSNFSERWSGSVQGGLGTSINITDRFDVSFVAQYMMHLGTRISAASTEGVTTFTRSKGYGIQDHVLLHLSLNYKIADLW